MTPRSRRSRLGLRPGADVDGHPGDIIASDLDLPGVDAGPDFEVECHQGVSDGDSALYCVPRAIEGGHEAITDGLHLPAPETFNLLAYALVVTVEQVSPTFVSQLCGAVSGAHNVCEHHGGKNPLRTQPAPDASDELLDLLEHRSAVAHPVEDVSSGHLGVLRVDVLGEVSTASGGTKRAYLPVEPWLRCVRFDAAPP